ncbi:MAG: hypothetical protein M1831_005984 [Alyxoria varia]|nr:MAG: hypothetical protein M1831_005984 [Alyxoria varia]
MPSKFPWSKSKASQQGSSTFAEKHQRSSSRQGDHPQRQFSPDQYSQEEVYSQNYSDFDKSGHTTPDPFARPSSQGLQPPTDPRQPVSYQSSPTSPTSQHQPEHKKSFRERFGLTSSSRENLSDPYEDKPKTVRRRLSTRRKEAPPLEQEPLPDNPQDLPFSQVPKTGGATSPENRGETRDLAQFLRSTGPSSDPRRPISLGGDKASVQAQPHWETDTDSPRSFSTSVQPTGQPPGNRTPGYNSEAQNNTEEDDRDFEKELGGRSTTTQQAHHEYQAYHRPQQDSSAGLKSQSNDLGTVRGSDEISYEFRPSSKQQDSQLGTYTAERFDADETYYQRALQATEQKGEHPPSQPRPTGNTRTRNDSLFFDRNTSGMQSAHSSLQAPPRRGSADVDPPTPAMPGKSHSATSPRPPPHGHSVDSGRRSPQPRAVSDMTEQEMNQLMLEYRELREKYSKVKRYYFDKESQVTQLQNAVAHQRLSQSRTSLDDGEYVSRMTRLDGLIAQLAFGFRKEWKTIPSWMQTSVNKDAIPTGKQEMTAVGRAFVSRWLVEQVFEKFFHPSLDREVSKALKGIQLNLRRTAPVLQTGEEEEALTAKIINWRLSTIDGLLPHINSAEASSHRQALTETLTAELVGHIVEHMQDPPPVGIEGGVNMIMELVISILGHLPFESRDVNIEYFPPGSFIHPDLMKIETGIPVLSDPMAVLETRDGDDTSTASNVEQVAQSDTQTEDTSPARDQSSGKKSFLGGIIGSKKRDNIGSFKQGSGNESQTSLSQQPPASAGAKDEQAARVRLCVLPGLQIRGKMVLAKAPVYKI